MNGLATCTQFPPFDLLAGAKVGSSQGYWLLLPPNWLPVWDFSQSHRTASPCRLNSCHCCKA